MSKYVYPAVFTKEKKGYSVDFPDLPGCYTCGDDLADAIYMAEDVLPLTLCDYEDENRIIPEPSVNIALILNKGEFISFVRCDTVEYRRKLSSKAVKKTVSV